MPFDGSVPLPTRDDRLARLRVLLERSGDQSKWSTCLWGEAARDPVLAAAGMPFAGADDVGIPLHNPIDRASVRDFFGLNLEDARVLFGLDPKEWKVDHLRALMRHPVRLGWYRRAWLRLAGALWRARHAV